MLYNFMGMKTHGPVRCGSSSGAESFGGPGLGIAPRAARNRNLAGAQGPPAGARMQTTARPTRGPRLLAGLALSGLTRVGLPLLLVLGIVSVADATTVKKMDLSEICDSADRIFRGRVLGIEAGTVEAGGAELPTVTYRIEVTEAMRGAFTRTQDGKALVEITTLGVGRTKVLGAVTRFPKLPELPVLTQGREYLLFVTPESPLGLSTTVGLGQGRFGMYAGPDGEMAVNEIGNVDLSPTIDGPVRYKKLTNEIRALIGD